MLFFMFFLFVYFNGAFLLSHLLKGQLGIPIAMEKVQFNSSEITIANIIVPNPQKSESPYAIRIDHTLSEAPVVNYVKNPTKIKQLLIENVTMFMETYEDGSSNWKLLGEKIDAASKTNKKTDSQTLIDELIIRKINLFIITPGKKPIGHPIDELKFTDVQTAGGDLPNQISRAILYKLIFNYRNLIDIPMDWGESVFNSFSHSVDTVIPFKNKE
ncbi:MAG: hypothetical protein A3F09_02905 [Chlamydiae bacterium RIFCSPHIGHO2_12_FULL_49_11]|nr:MAG: hypothetical protein A3F09_02905 [Chlamydiae bacterium RIFCSPHIGHO2_12_FULL_49_11]